MDAGRVRGGDGPPGTQRYVSWALIALLAWGVFGSLDWVEADGTLNGRGLLGRTLLFLWYGLLGAIGWKVWRRYSAAKMHWDDADEASYDAANARIETPATPDLPEGWYEPPDRHDGRLDINPSATAGAGTFDLDRYWPRFGGLAFALFAMLHFSDGLTRMPDLGPAIFASGMAFLMGTGIFTGLRNLVRSTRRVRTFSYQTSRFRLGALVGLAFFVATQIIGGDASATAADPWDLSDGVGRAEVGIAARGLLGLISSMALCGLLFEFVGKRIGGVLQADGSDE